MNECLRCQRKPQRMRDLTRRDYRGRWACERAFSIRAGVEEASFRRGMRPRRIRSNLQLTSSTFSGYRSNLQLLHVDRVLSELIECGYHSGVGLVAALSDDHVRELGRNVHVRLFQRAAGEGAAATAACHSDCRGTRGKSGLEAVLTHTHQTLWVGEIRQDNLTQGQRLVVGERTLNGSVRRDAVVRQGSAAVAVLEIVGRGAGADDWVSREFPVASCRFQVMLMLAAPSARPVIAMPVTGAAGVARVPSGLNVTLPVVRTVGAPAPPVSAAGR